MAFQIDNIPAHFATNIAIIHTLDKKTPFYLGFFSNFAKEMSSVMQPENHQLSDNPSLSCTASCEAKAGSIRCGGHLMDFSSPAVMGIINCTPDSFFEESRTFNVEAVMHRAVGMAEAGVDIFDIGGYSSRPGAAEVSPEEEWRRLDMALAPIRKAFPDIPVSVDTFRASVARKCVENYNVEIINDIGGGTLDPDMWATVADLKTAYVLMHMRGRPETMQSLTDYGDVTAEVMKDLAFKLDSLRLMGVADVIIDPGFGFAKTVRQNFSLLDNLEIFQQLGCPVLAGLSHKTMIWKTLGITPAEALDGTIALDTVALMKGADILRVHDVKPAVQTVALLNAMNNSK